jgi:hypothetical protein
MGVYIAVHALGWNAYFPTGAKTILWRVSVCAFAVGTMCLLLLALGLEWHTWHTALFGTLLISSVLLSALARLVLIIEALAGVHSLPVAVYNTPSWSDMLPHIG